MRLSIGVGGGLVAFTVALLGALMYQAQVPSKEVQAWHHQWAATMVAAAMALGVGLLLLASSEALDRHKIRSVLQADIDETIDAFKNWGAVEEDRGLKLHVEGAEAIRIRLNLVQPVGILEAAKSVHFDRTTTYLLTKAVGEMDAHRVRADLMLQSITLRGETVERPEIFNENLRRFYLDPLEEGHEKIVTLLQTIRMRVFGAEFQPGSIKT